VLFTVNLSAHSNINDINKSISNNKAAFLDAKFTRAFHLSFTLRNKVVNAPKINIKKKLISESLTHDAAYFSAMFIYYYIILHKFLRMFQCDNVMN
jgi:hypothetical protein